MNYIRIAPQIISKLKTMIKESTLSDKPTAQNNALHKAILHKYYNACWVQFDYDHKRVQMEILVNPEELNHSNPKTPLRIMPMSLGFEDLESFLIQKIDTRDESLGYYCSLLKQIGKNQELQLN